MSRVFVAGAGAWGTALAQSLAGAGHPVDLWARDGAHAAQLQADGANPRYLPGVALHHGIAPTADRAAAAHAGIVLLACPSHAVAEQAAALAPWLPPGCPIVICAKGLDRTTGRPLSEVVAMALRGAPVAVLSGPSFADEVARGLPAALTLATADLALAQALAERLAHPYLRLYATRDIVGVELGGAVKNVIAVAAGIVAGLALGENARAALVTRGFAEMARFGLACGAQIETVQGLSGLGDLLLTAGSAKSRNFRAGMALATAAPDGAAGPPALTEGVAGAATLAASARRRGIDMPIADAVAAIVAGTLPVAAAMHRLMTRPLRTEH